MKTRQNHRKTTTSRRRRRVVKQQRVQTRIHRRKGTAVSSRRRDYFFKRGGGEEEDKVINTILQGLDFGILKTAMIEQGIITDPSTRVSLALSAIPTSINANPTTVSFTLNGMNIEFKLYVNGRLGEVYVFVNNKLCGKIVVVINNKHIIKDYDAGTATAINSAVLSYYEKKIKPNQ